MFRPKIEPLKDWDEVVEAFSELPKPTLDFSGEEPNRTVWIFRGHKRRADPLQPTIERMSEHHYSWARLEHQILTEFQSRARLYIKAHEIPTEPLSWLALMRHLGVPTRLLDFTQSPYVAMYSEPASLWYNFVRALVSRK